MSGELIHLAFTLAVVMTGFCLADAMLRSLCESRPAEEPEPPPRPGWQDEGDPVGKH